VHTIWIKPNSLAAGRQKLQSTFCIKLMIQMELQVMLDSYIENGDGKK